VGENITVSGTAPGFPGARMISSADPSIFMIPTEAVLRDLSLIKGGDKGQGLLIANGLAERVRVIAPESIACELGSVDSGNAVIRNSVCSGGEPGVLISVEGVGLEFGVLDGVTAHSSGPGAFDFSGEARIQAGAIDIGADEFPDPAEILDLLGKKLKAKRALSFMARCRSTPCEVSGKAVVKPKSAKKATRKLKPASAGAGETTKVKVRLSKRLARKLKRSGGKVTVRAVGAADPLGFSEKARKRYRVKKR
jgi:hypothetical protein